MRLRRAAALAAVVVTAVAALVGCAEEQPRSDDAGGHGGHSGHSGQTDGSGTGDDGPEPVTPPPGADWNAADAEYLTGMIHHHRQAIEMSLLATDRASDPAVRTLADTIDAGQGREILVMAAWLDEHDLPVPTLAEMEHGGHVMMPGMLGEAQMADLAAATGPEFDELYLTGMVQHHLGAVEMAEDEVAEGLDTVVVDMAGEVIAGQTAEIRRMRQLLAR